MCLQATVTCLKSKSSQLFTTDTRSRRKQHNYMHSHSRYCMNTNYILKGVSWVELKLCQSGNKFSKNQLISPTPHTPLWPCAAFVHWCLKRMSLVSSVFADDLSHDLCCSVALSGGACVFWCKRVRWHDQHVDMIIVGSHVLRVILKCLEQHGQEHQEFLIFLAHNVTLAPQYHMLKAKSKKLYVIMNCIQSINVSLISKCIYFYHWR